MSFETSRLSISDRWCRHIWHILFVID